VPIVLATLPVSAGLPGAQRVFDVVFLLVVVFTVLQGPTLPWTARRLGVSEPSITRELSIEFAPFESLGATMITLDVPRGSMLAGVSINELRLPGDAVISLVVRERRAFVPSPTTQLRSGDHLLIAASDEHRAEAERRLRAVSRAGRLAAWRGETGAATGSD
jgi:cell volume regulation protein A